MYTSSGLSVCRKGWYSNKPTCCLRNLFLALRPPFGALIVELISRFINRERKLPLTYVISTVPSSFFPVHLLEERKSYMSFSLALEAIQRIICLRSCFYQQKRNRKNLIILLSNFSFSGRAFLTKSPVISY